MDVVAQAIVPSRRDSGLPGDDFDPRALVRLEALVQPVHRQAGQVTATELSRPRCRGLAMHHLIRGVDGAEAHRDGNEV